ncbi:hypothetical protein Glove_750g49 [Diversispora epigaea]|uniref:Uncharacterized protein n=1 Tax=Diversispora epigaea TaxID=1348612 RepID=A0A397G0G3_9GLOM|nr:hypothetical protein Glove_750g49 [Diversispora epigaea]
MAIQKGDTGNRLIGIFGTAIKFYGAIIPGNADPAMIVAAFPKLIICNAYFNFKNHQSNLECLVGKYSAGKKIYLDISQQAHNPYNDSSANAFFSFLQICESKFNDTLDKKFNRMNSNATTQIIVTVITDPHHAPGTDSPPGISALS